MRWLDSALSVLADTGLAADEMAAAVQSVDAYVRGHARIALTEGSPGERERWRAAQGRFLERHAQPGVFPTLAKVAAAGGFHSPEGVFEFGLARLLDGIETLIAGKRPDEPSPGQPPRSRGRPGSRRRMQGPPDSSPGA